MTITRTYLSRRIGLMLSLVGWLLITEAVAQPTVPKPPNRFVGGLKRTKGRGDCEPMPGIAVSDTEFARLPKVVSYEAFCPRAGDQNGRITTVAFATAYYLRTILENQARNIRSGDAVNDNRFSPTYLHNRIKLPEDVTCNEGVDVESALRVLETKGVALLKTTGDMTCSDVGSAAFTQEAARYKIDSHRALFCERDSPINKLRLLKKAMAQGAPVVVEFYAPRSFQAAMTIWRPSSKDITDPNILPLALCVVAYNDTLTIYTDGKTKVQGGFRVMNSWGADWGDEGSCWIAYRDMPAFTTGAYSATPRQAIAAPTSLSGTVEFKLTNGPTIPVALGPASSLQTYIPTGKYPVDSQCKAYITVDQPAYLYAWGIGSDQSVNQLTADNGDSTLLLKPGVPFVFPGTANSLPVTSEKNYLLLLISLQPIADLPTLARQLQQVGKQPPEQLSALLKARIPPGIRFAPNRISFGVSSANSPPLVPILVTF